MNATRCQSFMTRGKDTIMEKKSNKISGKNGRYFVSKIVLNWSEQYLIQNTFFLEVLIRSGQSKCQLE